MMFRRILTLFLGAGRWLVAALVLFCILADVVCELVGLPDVCANGVRSRFAEQGLQLQAETIKAGLVGGLVLDQARLRITCANMPVVAQFRQLRVRARMADLLLGKVTLLSAAFEGFSVSLYPSGLASDDSKPSLSLQRCDGSVHLRPNQSLAVYLEGLLANIQMNLNADVSGLNRLKPRATSRRDTMTPPPTGPETKQESPLAQQLQRLAVFLERCQLTESDAFLSGTVNLDLEAVDEVEFAGQFGVTDTFIEDVMLRKAKGSIHYRDHSVTLSKLAVFISRDENLTGRVVCNLAEGRVSGSLRGDVRPETACLIARLKPPEWLSRLRFTTPVSVTAELLPSPLDPAQWQIRADVLAASVGYNDLILSGITAGVCWDGRTLGMMGLAGTVGTVPGDEYVAGDVCWDAQDQTLAGGATLLVRPLERLRQVGIMLPRSLRDAIELPDPVLLQVRLEPSPTTWTRWRLQGDFACSVLSGWHRDIGPLVSRLELSAGVLSLTDLTIGLADAPADVLRLQGRIDLRDALAQQALEADVTLHGLAPRTMSNPALDTLTDPAWIDAVTLHGTARIADGMVTASAEGTAYPGRFYSAVQERLRIPDEGVVNRIYCNDAQARIRVEIAAGKGIRGFRLQGSADAENVRYGDVTLRQAHTGVELDTRHIRLVEATGTTMAGDELALDLDIQFNPTRVTIRDGRVVGDPRVAAAFIDHPESRRIYETVWQDFTWDPAAPPEIALHSLVYQGLGEALWKLNVNADFRSHDVDFRDLHARALDATVVLDLPGSVNVRDARVETASGSAKGSVEILTGDIPKCSFEIGQFEGGTDPRQILHAINPEWDEWLEQFGFSDESSITCKGSFYLSREPRLRIYGTVRSPFCEFAGLRFTHPEINWQLKESRLFWDLQKGKLFDGDGALTGTYDTETGQGLIAFRCDGMRLFEVGRHFGVQASEETLKGRLSGHCRLQVLRGWAGREKQISGNGRLALTGGDVWRVPLFTSLGKLLDVTFISRLTGGRASSLGTITRIDTDLSFNGDRVIIRNLTTDGTLLSLAGKGEYDWESDRVYLAVNGRALEKMSILSFVFRPLSWVFNAEMTGTSKQAKWRLSTPLQKGGTGLDGMAPSE